MKQTSLSWPNFTGPLLLDSNEAFSLKPSTADAGSPSPSSSRTSGPTRRLSSSRLRFSPRGSDRLATGSRRRPDLVKTDEGYPPGIGVKNTLLILGGINCLGVLFTFLVPESTGKSLKEMSQENEEDEGTAESTLRSKKLQKFFSNVCKKLQKFFTKERRKTKKCLEIF
ncbi:hypothetical protein U1Q18_010339 [Sarracenia purpurea var. burkii]